MLTAWLIEAHGGPVVLYYCNDGDWCSNPNHAHKFETVEEANIKAATMTFAHGSPVVVEHGWE